ncbi:MAG: prolyl oligopeptidase family serine peptidase [Limnochordia bacterium]|jgi:prolyl oligopeptidase
MRTRKVDVVENYHGTMVADPYRWLENAEDPEVLDWVRSQGEITEEFLSGIEARPSIKQRLTELWDYPRSSLPFKVGSWYYFQKNSGLQNQPVLFRQESVAADPKEIIDPNAWSEDGTIALSGYSPEEKGRYLAYTVSAHGSDRQEIRILDLEKGEHLPEVIKYCRFTNMAWRGEEGFFYTRYPKPGTVAPEDENNFNQVFWHQLGTEQEQDVLIYERPDAKELSFYPRLTQDEKYLVLHVYLGTDSRNGFYYKPIDSDGPFIELLQHAEASYNFLGSDGTTFYFFTDLNAPRGRLISIDIARPERENWVEILPEQEDVISDARLINNHFVVSFMHNAHSRVRLYDLNGKLVKELPLPTLGTVTGIAGRQSHTEFFLGFTSFLYPTVSLRYDFATGELEFFAEQKYNFDPDQFQVNQVFYPSKDGTMVSMYLVHKKGLELNGDNPTLLYGYGGFNISITPSFAPSRIWWLEQGGVYVEVNLRGGSEYGEEWHQAGMLANKQNVFDDFIAAAEWLIANKYTRTEKLAIEGRSNGGLLVSACMVQRPDLFGAVICGVPVTDMLRYHKWTVGRYWIPEYGNAEENPEHFAFLYRYSPLHNVKPASYPATLVVTAEGDDRVVPGHAFKFTAALQEGQQGSAPILLRVDRKSGHGHGKPTAKIIDEHADVYSFLSRQFAM